MHAFGQFVCAFGAYDVLDVALSDAGEHKCLMHHGSLCLAGPGRAFILGTGFSSGDPGARQAGGLGGAVASQL